MSNNNNIVRIDNKRYSEIKMYAAFKGLKIVNIVNQAVDAYLNNSEEFIQFKLSIADGFYQLCGSFYHTLRKDVPVFAEKFTSES